MCINVLETLVVQARGKGAALGPIGDPKPVMGRGKLCCAFLFFLGSFSDFFLFH